MTNVHIRVATPDDAEEILKIYAPYVQNTAVSFEYNTPELPEFRRRIENTLKRYPYLVAEDESGIVGYAYTGAFSERAAYDWAAAATIYLKAGKTKQGLGKKLYLALEGVTKAQNISNINACIAYPETEDEYLTKNSAHFHAHMGYAKVGEFHKCGYKFGRWYNMLWMEKMIGEHTEAPLPVTPFPALGKNVLRALDIRC